MKKIKDRKIVIVNQAVNYLTIGFANSFYERFENVSLITGSIHAQGEELNSGIKVQLINQWYESPVHRKIWSFSVALLKIWTLVLFKYPRHEVFFVSVPPMGYLLNLILPNRFSMVIWDIYPDVLKISGMRDTHFLYRLWSFLNKKSFKKAYRLYTITPFMAQALEKYVQRDKIIVLPIWSIFQNNDKVPSHQNPFVKEHKLENKFVVQYSGNIGLTHNVEILITIAELLRFNDKIVFQIIGRGHRKSYLKKLVEDKKLLNCMFVPFQSDEMFPYSLSSADLGVVVLEELVSKGSVPSKSYNLMSYGIPSLYVSSKDSQLNIYAQEYGHAKCFTKQELQEIAAFIVSLSMDDNLRKQMSECALMAAQDFRRSNANKFVDAYLS